MSCPVLPGWTARLVIPALCLALMAGCLSPVLGWESAIPPGLTDSEVRPVPDPGPGADDTQYPTHRGITTRILPAANGTSHPSTVQHRDAFRDGATPAGQPSAFHRRHGLRQRLPR